MKMLLVMFLMTMKKYHSNMYINLLQHYYDIQCELFIKGIIDYNAFEILEIEYFKRVELFTYCLN